jgi:hypothetical protein
MSVHPGFQVEPIATALAEERRSFAPPAMAIRLIIGLVARRAGVTFTEILSHRRAREIVDARHVAMYLAWRWTMASLPVIARRFADRDHTTVHHAVHRIEALVAGGGPFADFVCSIESEIPEVLGRERTLARAVRDFFNATDALGAAADAEGRMAARLERDVAFEALRTAFETYEQEKH